MMSAAIRCRRFIPAQRRFITLSTRFVTPRREFSTGGCYAQRAFDQHTSGTSLIKEIVE
jgi:hypothetical protein